jgi:cell division protein FtsX
MQEKKMAEEEKKEKSLEEMTVKELRETAREIPGVSGFSVMKKEELIALIKKERGIEEIKEEKEIAEKPPEDEKPLNKMTAKELREIAKEIPGVAGVTAMKKEELLAVIKEHRGIKDEKPAKKKKVKADAPVTSVRELKDKIIQLREEKREARQANDRHKIDILRRRINRLKKQTRKVARA